MSAFTQKDGTVRVGLVIGDPAGISPELTAKLLADADAHAAAAILVIGDSRVLARGAETAQVSVAIPAVRDIGDAELSPGQPLLLDLGHLDPGTFPMGEASAAGGAFAMRNFRVALELAKSGRLDAVFFTPFNKYALRLAGNPYLDEIQFAADVLGAAGPHAEFNVLGDIWNARVTSHVPLKDVASLLSVDSILEALALTDRAMRGAGFARPRIAVAALNPHAGDGGNFGREEIDIIAPAVAEAQRRQMAVDGPFPADTVYLRVRNGQFDAVLSMYHDQGQIAIKLMGFDRGVTVLGGLPVPICTPAHGTAYDIAGRGVANAQASKAALALAKRLGAARRTSEEERSKH